ncbi:hypothetical protein [Actinomadura fibrosa]|uniref:DmpG-like communication domain-containing protein n=1 Tax=Actinomadura fibrosa TaxID=111802 RepID=A0ABW2XS75_9ACTN|nr:hypothetical protein [Actinomadura fibrosa]
MTGGAGHAGRGAERYDPGPARILSRCGDRRPPGGQEDRITRIAHDLAKEKN